MDAGFEGEVSLRDRQEITWTFECPIAPHLGSLLNRKIRDVELPRLWCRSIGRDPIGGTLGPQDVQLISCRPFNVSHSGNWALIAIGTQHAIGIDVGTVRDKVEYEGLSKSFFLRARKNTHWSTSCRRERSPMGCPDQ